MVNIIVIKSWRMPLFANAVFLTIVLHLMGIDGLAQSIVRSASFSSGAGAAQGTTHKLKGTIGQPIIGNASSTSYKLQTGFVPAIAIDQFPDLAFTANTMNPGTVAPGQQVSLFFTVKNSGNAVAIGTITVKAFLSLDPSYQSTDTELVPAMTIGSDLVADGSIVYGDDVNEINKVTIPATTAVGAYYIVLVVDPANTIRERLETNNATSGMALTVSTNDPNLDLTPPVIATVSQPATFTSGANISVQVADDKSGVQQVTFYHRHIASTEAFAPSQLVATGSTFSVSADNTWADELGMEGYFSATDNANNPSNNSALYFWYKRNAPTESIPFTGSFSGKASSYKMFSLPYVPDDKNFESIFDELGAYNKEKWRLFHYDNSSNAYKEYKQGLSTNIESGNGYWFVAANELTESIKIGAGKVYEATKDSPFSTTLAQGWNQIGNPYPFNVEWQKIKDANPTVGVNALHVFENGQYQKPSVLAAWKGAFVWADNGGAVIFPVVSRTTASGRMQSTELPDDPDAEAWELPLTLSFHDLNQTSSIGMHPLANESKDKFDDIALPTFTEYVEMGTYHPEYKAHWFTSDVLPTALQASWEFQLKSNHEEGTAVLSWDNTKLVDTESKFLLVDISDGTWIDMKTQGQYSFMWKDDRQINISYSRHGDIDPAMTILGNAYPNPFSSQITIPVLVRRDALKVKVDVYDMLGRRMRSLTEIFDRPGPNEIFWDGRDSLGREVSDGVFIYRLADSNQMKRIVKR